jgi:hypothetical protein
MRYMLLDKPQTKSQEIYDEDERSFRLKQATELLIKALLEIEDDIQAPAKHEKKPNAVEQKKLNLHE